MRYIARDVLQVDGLRKYYSAELCALLVALVSRDPMNRPSLASVLEWPVMRDSAWGREHARFLPKVKRGPSDGAEPLGSEKHAAAQVLQRSFKRSFGKRAAAPKPAPVELSEGEVELDATLPNDHAAAAQPKPGDRNFDPTAAAAANYARHAAMIAAKAAIRREAPRPQFKGKYDYQMDTFLQDPLTPPKAPIPAQGERGPLRHRQSPYAPWPPSTE